MASRLAAAPQRETEATASDIDGLLTASRDAPVGGQAVLEGVMMRGVSNWAVAVRKPVPQAAAGAEPSAQQAAAATEPAGPQAAAGAEPVGPQAAAGAGPQAAGRAEPAGPRAAAGAEPSAQQAAAATEPSAPPSGQAEHSPSGQADPAQGEIGDIEVTCFPLESALARHRWLRLPVIRGIVALGGSLTIGFRALGIAANAQLPPGEGEQEPQEISGGVWVGTIVVALAFAIGVFFLLPLGLTSLVKSQLHSSVLFWVIEGVLRTAIFLGYLLLLTRIKDLRRVFEYHGAEHKTISCFEAGLPLTPANAQRFSRLHPRCGTSFLLVVMVVSIFVFGAIGMHAFYWLILIRVLGVPLIAGISFELIKFAGRNRRRRWVRALMWPGLKLQLLTTREPDLSQLAVAIAALKAVLEREDFKGLTAADLVGVEVVA